MRLLTKRNTHVLSGPIEIHAGLPWQRCTCGQLHIPGSIGVTQAAPSDDPRYTPPTTDKATSATD